MHGGSSKRPRGSENKTTPTCFHVGVASQTCRKRRVLLRRYADFSDSPAGDCAGAAADFFFVDGSARETNSMATISAASPIRRRVFTIRVYPPGRSLKRPATSLNSFDTTALLRRNPRARRRAGSVPSFPRLIMRSVNPRISLAFASVVSIRSWSSKDVTRLRNRAQRCLVWRPSCRPFFLCRTAFPLAQELL